MKSASPPSLVLFNGVVDLVFSLEEWGEEEGLGMKTKEKSENAVFLNKEKVTAVKGKRHVLNLTFQKQ